MRYARKRDESESAIVDALQKAGCQIWRGNEVDLYVARGGRLWGVECKSPGRQKRLQPVQRWLQANWENYCVVDSPEAALEAIGIATNRRTP